MCLLQITLEQYNFSNSGEIYFQFHNTESYPNFLRSLLQEIPAVEQPFVKGGIQPFCFDGDIGMYPIRCYTHDLKPLRFQKIQCGIDSIRSRNMDTENLVIITLH